MKAIQGWPTRQLRELADIRVSNVDKKFYASEKPVKLCNYMDVHTNEYVKDNIQFIEASATPAEIEQFSLNRGDVIITKDSETPDDIGIPAVITEKINDLVCGYNLALIRPNQEYLDPVYLAKQLCTSDIVRYFAVKASGSTRFGLSIGAIETIEIPTPPKPEQTKIAEILQTVDRAIEQTEVLIAKQQCIKTGLMQDLLTRGIDEHGNLRSEQTHEFKDSSLGRIPVEWEVVLLSYFVKRLDAGISVNSDDKPCGSGQIGVLKTSALNKGDFLPEQNKTVLQIEENRVRVSPTANTILISRMNTPDLVGESGFVDKNYPHLFSPDRIWMTIFQDGKEKVARWLFFVMTSPHARSYITLNAKGTSGSMKNLPKASIFKMPLRAPTDPEEQQQIARLLECQNIQIGQMRQSLEKLRSLKTALVQDLLTGKVRVTPLLEDGTP